MAELEEGLVVVERRGLGEDCRGPNGVQWQTIYEIPFAEKKREKSTNSTS